MWALLAFAANSLLCRLALGEGGDAAQFTALRLGSGALVLALLLRQRGGSAWRAGHWRGAAALFAYAAGFSWAYVQLDAATGALPMVTAGVAWGLYSLWGRGARDPLADTAGNFVRTLPFAGILLLATTLIPGSGSAGFAAGIDARGALAAVASGALASGLGYVAWYAVVPRLGALRAAALQLSVPVITALGAIALLGETPGPRQALAAAGILGGIALVLRGGGAAR